MVLRSNFYRHLVHHYFDLGAQLMSRKVSNAFFVGQMLGTADVNDIRHDVLIECEAQGIIVSVAEGASPRDVNDPRYRYRNGIVTPTFVNAHTHVMDNIGKGRIIGRSLEESVGTDGIKFKILANTDELTLKNSLHHAMKELQQSGTSIFFDFREGGVDGVLFLKKVLQQHVGLNALILGRPQTLDDVDEVCQVADGFGLATPNLYPDEELDTIRETARNHQKLLATHLMESRTVVEESRNSFGKSDLERAVDLLQPDVVVHLTQALADDMELISDVTRLMVFCPRSNAFFGLGFPPVRWCLEHGTSFALGTDNAMTTPLDVLGEARWLIWRLAESYRHMFNDQLLLECYRALVEYPAQQLGLNHGRIAPGYHANFIIWDATSPRLNPANNILEHLLLRSSKKDIVRVFFQGNPVRV